MAARSLASAVLLLAVGVVAACTTDPVHQAEVDALGPEASNVPQGPNHRAGQPCVVCHGSEGPAKTQFSIAGTVFDGPGISSALVGVGGVTVSLEDDSQSRFQVTTNCVGNFWVNPSDWNPQFPVLVAIAGGTTAQTMQSHIGREPSCGQCHQLQVGPGPGTPGTYFKSPGTIYLQRTDDPNFKGDPTCSVQPPTPVGLAPLP